MNEEEFRVELNQIKSAVLFTADREKIVFLKKRVVSSSEENLLKIVIGDYLFYAVELADALYISLKKDQLQKLLQKLEKIKYNEVREKLARLMDNQKEDEIISVEASMLNNYLKEIGARFERRSVLDVEVLILLFKGEERQIAIQNNRAYISKRLLINELESYMSMNNLKQLTEEEFKKFVAERYKVIEV